MKPTKATKPMKPTKTSKTSKLAKPVRLSKAAKKTVGVSLGSLAMSKIIGHMPFQIPFTKPKPREKKKRRYNL